VSIPAEAGAHGAGGGFRTRGWASASYQGERGTRGGDQACGAGNRHWQPALASGTGNRRWQPALATGTGKRHWEPARRTGTISPASGEQGPLAGLC
jgi:hypothetical protein